MAEVTNIYILRQRYIIGEKMSLLTNQNLGYATMAGGAAIAAGSFAAKAGNMTPFPPGTPDSLMFTAGVGGVIFGAGMVAALFLRIE